MKNLAKHFHVHHVRHFCHVHHICHVHHFCHIHHVRHVHRVHPSLIVIIPVYSVASYSIFGVFPPQETVRLNVFRLEGNFIFFIFILLF